jgi:hypothetical protein
MAHDVLINLGVGVGIDYIGQGSFDQFFGRIFQQSGWVYLVFRLFLFSLGTLTYFEIIKD